MNPGLLLGLVGIGFVLLVIAVSETIRFIQRRRGR